MELEAAELENVMVILVTIVKGWREVEDNLHAQVQLAAGSLSLQNARAGTVPAVAATCERLEHCTGGRDLWLRLLIQCLLSVLALLGASGMVSSMCLLSAKIHWSESGQQRS